MIGYLAEAFILSANLNDDVTILNRLSISISILQFPCWF